MPVYLLSKLWCSHKFLNKTNAADTGRSKRHEHAMCPMDDATCREGQQTVQQSQRTEHAAAFLRSSPTDTRVSSVRKKPSASVCEYKLSIHVHVFISLCKGSYAIIMSVMNLAGGCRQSPVTSVAVVILCAP